MSPETVGAILAGFVAVLFGGFKLLDHFFPSRQGQLAIAAPACPLNVDSEIKLAIIKMAEAQGEISRTLNELRTDHRMHDRDHAELKEAIQLIERR